MKGMKLAALTALALLSGALAQQKQVIGVSIPAADHG